MPSLRHVVSLHADDTNLCNLTLLQGLMSKLNKLEMLDTLFEKLANMPTLLAQQGGQRAAAAGGYVMFALVISGNVNRI